MMNHTFKIISQQFKTIVIKSQVCLVHCYNVKNQPSIYQCTIAHLVIFRIYRHSPRKHAWFKQNLFIHRNHKLNKQVQETQKHKHKCLSECYL